VHLSAIVSAIFVIDINIFSILQQKSQTSEKKLLYGTVSVYKYVGHFREMAFQYRLSLQRVPLYFDNTVPQVGFMLG